MQVGGPSKSYALSLGPETAANAAPKLHHGHLSHALSPR